MNSDLPMGMYTPDSPEGRGYRADPADNYSAIKKMDASPLHYQDASERGVFQTPAMALGVVGHVATLQPELLDSAAAVFEGGARRGKAWTEFQAEHAGQIILKADEMERIKAMADAVRSHPVASQYLKGHAEMSMFWKDQYTGLRCKGRPDIICGDVVVDLKTTTDASPAAFSRQCANLFYHAQAAFYQDGYELVTSIEPRSVYIVAEVKPPYDVVVYDADPDMINIGRDAYHEWLVKLEECRKSNVWPGRAPTAAVPLTLPPWAMPREDDDLTDLGLE